MFHDTYCPSVLFALFSQSLIFLISYFMLVFPMVFHWISEFVSSGDVTQFHSSSYCLAVSSQRCSSIFLASCDLHLQLHTNYMMWMPCKPFKFSYASNHTLNCFLSPFFLWIHCKINDYFTQLLKIELRYSTPISTPPTICN